MESAVSILLVVGGLFAALGSGFFAVGVRTRRSARRFKERAVRVPGLVVDLEFHRGHRTAGDVSSGYWVPRLRFTTVDGRPVEMLAMYGSVPAPARPGEQVMVLYDPEQPTKAQVADRVLASGGCLSVAMLVVGGSFAVLGLLLCAVGVIIFTKL
jgi:hypothetical protein